MSTAGEKLVVATAGRKVSIHSLFYFSFKLTFFPLDFFLIDKIIVQGVGVGYAKYVLCPAEAGVQSQISDQVKTT
jgi:hypothetical protein